MSDLEPITQGEFYMAAAAGEYDGELPDPVIKPQEYWVKIIERIDNSCITPEEIDAAIEAYLNSHDADIVTEQELFEALTGYYNKRDIDTALDGKADVNHTHSGMYAPASHNHAQSDITGLDDALSGKAPVSHSHAQSDVIGLEDALSGKAAAVHHHDDRYYTETEIDTALAGKAAASHEHDDRYYTETEMDSKLGEKSNAGHSHVVADVTGLDSALAGKAAASHSHVVADVTGLAGALAGKAPASHTHTKSQITDLANASASAAGLMSAADFKKINAQNITSGSDLNDIKSEGWYVCYANSTAATLSHCPTTVAFYLEVHKHAGVYQHIVEYSTTGAKHFHRNFYNDVWGNWVEWKLTDTTYSNATPSTNGVGGSAGLMSGADKEKLDGMTAVLNAEILFDSASGTAVTNASPSITFDSGKSLSSYTDGYLEVFYKQNAGTNGGVNAIRTLIHSVSGTVTVEPVQLLGWTYDSANTALSLLACAGTVSNGNTITFSNPENADFSFTIYRIVGYK